MVIFYSSSLDTSNDKKMNSDSPNVGITIEDTNCEKEANDMNDKKGDAIRDNHYFFNILYMSSLCIDRMVYYKPWCDAWLHGWQSVGCMDVCNCTSYDRIGNFYHYVTSGVTRHVQMNISTADVNCKTLTREKSKCIAMPFQLTLDSCIFIKLLYRLSCKFIQYKAKR